MIRSVSFQIPDAVMPNPLDVEETLIPRHL